VKTLLFINSVVFALSISGILLVFLFTPVLVLIVYLIKGKYAVKDEVYHPSVSFITVVHNAEDLIVNKISNTLFLNYPSNKYEIIIYSDGSNDNTENNVMEITDKRIRFYSCRNHEGKNASINKAVKNCSGEILLFSDVSAILDSDAVSNLVKHFADSSVGGVCGNMIIYKDCKELEKAQSIYAIFANFIKKLENQTGSISSNNGALFAVRRELFQPVPLAVTDDFYLCLSIVRQHYRFVYESDAKAFIKARATEPSHEVQRRRRIVTRSLRGIYLMKEILNPFNYNIFSLSILINKIARRLLPVFLILFFISSIFLSFRSPLIKILLYLEILFYLIALSYRTFFQFFALPAAVTKIASTAYYFCLGNYGTLLGLFDFLMGRQIDKWEPLHTDN